MNKLGIVHYNFPGFSFQRFLKFAAETSYRYAELQLPDVWGKDVWSIPINMHQPTKSIRAFV